MKYGVAQSSKIALKLVDGNPVGRSNQILFLVIERGTKVGTAEELLVC